MTEFSSATVQRELRAEELQIGELQTGALKAGRFAGTSNIRLPVSVMAAFIIVAIAVTTTVGCYSNPPAPGLVEDQGTRPVVATTNGPLADMVRSIAGDFLEVVCPYVEESPNQFGTDQGVSGGIPAQAVLSMQRADIVFTNGPGADDAAWLNLISLQDDRVHATTSDEFEISDFIQVQDYRTVHSHGDQGEHSHPWLVPHCWLHPELASAQSISILNRLIQNYPNQENTFRKNHAVLANQLRKLNELAVEVGTILKSKGVPVIASDPRLLFFTRALNQQDNYLLWFDLPTSSQMAKILKSRLPDGNGIVLWAQRPAQSQVTTDGSLGIHHVVIDRIELDQRDGYLSAMRKNFESVKNAVEGTNH